MNDHSSFKTGTIGGTILTILGSIAWIEIEKTLVFGAIGAAVSFFVSYFLKSLIGKWERNRQKSSPL